MHSELEGILKTHSNQHNAIDNTLNDQIHLHVNISTNEICPGTAQHASRTNEIHNHDINEENCSRSNGQSDENVIYHTLRAQNITYTLSNAAEIDREVLLNLNILVVFVNTPLMVEMPSVVKVNAVNGFIQTAFILQTATLKM